MLIRAENICKSYAAPFPSSKQYPILKNASIYIEEGESVALVGPSGSGKTTLGMAITGLTQISKGDICFSGEKIHYPYKGKIRQSIQILFQTPELAFNPTLMILTSFQETYRLIKKTFDINILEDYLEQFGLYSEHIKRLPSTLSGGELQRLALARVLLLEPKLLVLDEPTSMLDTISQAQMIELLRTVQSRMGVGYLFISHDMPLARQVCSRFYKIEEGIVTEM